MMFYVFTLSLLVAVTLGEPKHLDPGPQVLSKENLPVSSSTQKSQKRYATKEVIVYLTPSQIKALQTGKAILRAPNSQDNNGGHILEQEPISHTEQHHHHLENLDLLRAPLFEDTKPASSPQIQDLPLLHDQSKKQLKSIPQFIYFYPGTQKPQHLEPQLQKQPIQKGFQVEDKNQWAPVIPVTEKNQEELLSHEPLQEHWNQLLVNNREQLKLLSHSQQPKLEQLLQFAPKYNEDKYEIEVQKFIQAQKNNEAEQKRALAEAEAIANSPPVVIHKEVKITQQRQVPVVKHVNVPVPSPFLVPIPEPFEVKVPQPYPVPVEIIKHIPVPILKTHSLEVDRPVRIEDEKHLPVPATKPLFNNDNPYFIDRIVPVEYKKEVSAGVPTHKPENLSIVRHLWKN